MQFLTPEEFHSEYLIYKDLTPEKIYKTYVAMREHSDGSFYTVILKEMDEKRAKIYQSLSCMWNPFLADTYEVFQVNNTSHSSKQKLFVAVTEYVYADGCPEEETLSLNDFIHKIGPLNPTVAATITVQICEGLNEFHKKGFVHRDLKPENIMISKYDTEHPLIKIVDFGGAKYQVPEHHADTTVIGTLGYQPPESLSSYTTNQADIYSIGCILNFMLTGLEPGICNYKGNHYIVNIIEKATNEDPSHRYSSVVLMQKELEHVLCTRLLDKIPVFRSLPGFRTHTLWKEVTATLSYITMLYIAVFCIQTFGIWGLGEVFVFYVIIPLIIIFNMGNLLRFFPVNLRKKNRLFYMIRTAIILISLFGPVFIDSIAGRI